MQEQSAFEIYLDDVEKRLRRLPAQARAEEMQEARIHLEALMAGFARQGQPEPEIAAIRQYGTPADVAGKICSAWYRGQASTFRAAFFYSLGLWILSFHQCLSILETIKFAFGRVIGFQGTTMIRAA